jgi:uncharacterized membrane protein YcaP (DUF421 family)
MDIVLRAAAVFVLLFVVTRTIGRRELGQLEPFDVILLVVMGDLIQQGVTQSDYSLTGTALAVSTLAVMTVAVSYLSFRVRRLRPILRRERITMEELRSQARLAQVLSLDDVACAVLETGGKISFIPRRAG